MVLFTAEDATVDQKCAIARDLLDRFAEVPVLFLRAISSPLVCHNLLFLIFPPHYVIVTSSCRNWIDPRISYRRTSVRIFVSASPSRPVSNPSAASAMQAQTHFFSCVSRLAMADLLANLEVPLSRTTGTKDLLYNLVARIDTFLQTQRQHEPPTSTSVLAMLAPASNERTSAPVPPSPPVQHLEPYQQQHYAAYSDPEPYGTANEEMLRVQLPPELLESWPWPFDFDFTQGFPGYMQADWSSINLMATNAVNASVT